MKKAIFTLTFLVFYIPHLLAQPSICGSNATMVPICADACIICDIDGFMGQNSSVVIGSGPPDFCTVIQHNIQWIGFLATSENLTLQLDVTNCTGGTVGSGLEIGIWETFDCVNYTSVSQCVGGSNGNWIQPGSSGTISTTAPLVVGQYYYFVMDGFSGSVCDYTVTVVSGSTQIPPLSPIGNITGDMQVCTGGSATYSINPVVGAPNIEWTVGGSVVGTGTSANITFPTSGTTQVCVEASNLCGSSVSNCLPVQVIPNPAVNIFESACQGTCVTYNGTDYCATGTYPNMFTGFGGCDSLVNLNVTITAPTPVEIFETACDGECVFYVNATYCNAGTYPYAFTGFGGCDSLVNFNLSFDDPITTPLSAIICEGDSIELENQIFTDEGVYNIVLNSFENCDSIIVFTLTHRPRTETFISDEICEGDTYIIDNESFDQTGIYEIIYPGVADNGCDSVVILNLTVIVPQDTLISESICFGDSIVVGTQSFMQAGMYQIPLLDQFGCDSLVNLELMLLPTPQGFVNEAICPGDTLTLANQNFTLEGDYLITIAGQTTCDSVVNLELSYLPFPESGFSESICRGDTLFYANELFTDSGDYVIRFDNPAGCDSLVNLSLTVIEPVETFLVERICAEDNFMVGNEVFDQTGQYEVLFTAASGCDSIVFLDLLVYSAFGDNLMAAICDGEEFPVGNDIFTESGDYQVVLPSYLGCDSTVNLNLTVYPLPLTDSIAVICEGEAVQIGNDTFTESGNFSVILPAFTACDSTIQLDLTVIPPKETFLSDTICDGEIVSVANQDLTMTGQYDFQLTATSGCDSLVYLDLLVLPNLTESLNERICDDETFTVGNETFDQTGQYQIPLIASTGCDSLVTLNLTVFENKFTTLNEGICEGDSTGVGGQFFMSAGQFTIPLIAASGCDSIVTLNLMVFENPETYLTERICDGDNVMIGDDVFTETGQYQIPFLSAENCDSTVFLDLFVSPNVQTTLTESICDDESINVGNDVFTETGQYQVMLNTSAGCDSLVTLNLTVFENKLTILNEAICQGDSIGVGGQVFGMEGQFTIPLFTTSGCDSIVILNLVVNELPETYLIEQICDGENVMIGNELFTETGQYQIPFISFENCDSTVFLDLLIFPNEQTILTESICEDETYSVGNEVFDADGQYQVLLTTDAGCDSLVILNLSIINFDTTNLVNEICKGETAMVGSQLFDQTGEYQVILTASTGCDSLVNLDLSVIPCEVIAEVNEANLDCFADADGILQFSIADGTPPFSYEWQHLEAVQLSGGGIVDSLNEVTALQDLIGGAYQIIITDINGFSQTLNTIVNEPSDLLGNFQASTHGDYNFLCHGDLQGFLNTQIEGGTPPYNFVWSNGAQSPNLDNIGAGTYSLTITDQNECQITLTQSLIEPPLLDLNVNFDDPDCLDELGSIEIESATGGVGSYQYQVNNEAFSEQLLFENLSDGNYQIIVQDENGCEAEVAVYLAPIPNPMIDLGDDLVIDLGEEIQLTPQYDFEIDSIIWEGSNMNCTDCLRPFVRPINDTNYTLIGIDEKGCVAMDNIMVFVRKNRQVFVPNAFSPNNDGINDLLTIYAVGDVQMIKSFQIFSRWGEQIFAASNFQPNDPRFGWNGTYRGEWMDVGVYVWMAEVEFLDGFTEIFSGDFVIME